jgi:nitroimidazol reductase NimA-like FMN-containing flavoprotein (pyridoxamine 5'-phosphate oxidase superfamily)
MAIVESREETKHGFNTLLNHLEKDPKVINEKAQKVDALSNKFKVLRLDITEMTGKDGK